MIEGGIAGGSAAHHAEQRRSVATRLVAEAKWLDAVADDERATAAYLERLSTAYAILHDLKLSGTQGNVDHVVVGPGGAFLVVTRRFNDQIVFRDGALYTGDRSLQGELEGLRTVAHEMAQALGTPVAPVLGFHGGSLPAAAPPQMDGVFVCAAENLVRVITRASHTLLPPHKVTDVTERALPLLFNPGSVLREELPPRPEPTAPPIDPRVPEVGILPPTPAVTLAPAVAAQLDEVARRREETIRALQMGSADAAAPQAPPAVPGPPATSPVGTPAGYAAFAAAAQANASTAAPSPATRKRSKGFVFAVIASLCLVAATLGAAASMVWKDDKGGNGAGTTTTTIFVDPSSTAAGPLAASLPAPLVEFSAVCPAAGAGWQLVPTWPGDIPGLTQYNVEVQQPDGTWTPLAPLLSSSVSVASMEGQAPNATLTFRITAVMSDGSQSINQPTPFTTPTSPC